jgi:dihydropteroate synthase
VHWQTTRFSIDLALPKVMGIVNVTPDSFSDGGQYASSRAAMAHCDALLVQGAHMLDIGGESTRPGASPLSARDELARVLPVVRYAVGLGVPVSVDTYKPEVMQAVLDLGADIINDVWALRWRDPLQPVSATDVVAAHPRCGVCLMHMHREPTTMQLRPMEGDAPAQVLAFLESVATALRERGVHASRICIDPGIGFGKTVQQNFSLLAHQVQLLALGYPVLAGWSRKSSLAAVTQAHAEVPAPSEPAHRVVPSVAAALIAAHNGARVLRVHDVKETVQALQVWQAVQAQAGTAVTEAPHDG